MTCQDINILSTNGMKIEIEICIKNGQFQLSVSNQINGFDPIFQSNVCHKFYSTPEAAFEDGLQFANDYLSKKGDSINRIENPCNAPFVSAVSQIDISNRKGLNVPVSVNGNKV
jgi:hypothetical protein